MFLSLVDREVEFCVLLRVPYTQYGFLSVFAEGVPVRKKDEILD